MPMSDNGMELTRRKILAGAGAVGVAGAAAGFGSSAFFSDQETFTNNQLVSGSLDLKVSWDEHYSDWMGDETQYASMPQAGETPDLSLPAPEGVHPIELVFSDRDAFMDATRQEQFPEGGLGDADPCEALADVPGDLAAPVIDLEDVKPGDFGEVTFDFASCDNPAYLWMNGGLIDESENGVNEVEAEDEDEEEGVVELTDSLRARAWYDDGSGGGNGNTNDGGNGDDGISISSAHTVEATSIATTGDTASDLADALIAEDITIDSASLNIGNDRQAGTFTGGAALDDPMDSGVILSSGDVADVEGPNSSGSTSVGNPDSTDADLDSIATGETNDDAILEVEFTVPDDADQIFFNYVFGSEEYNEYVGSSFNDAFGLFLNGTNIATIDDPDNPGEDTVSINNINNGENSELYNDNTVGNTDETEMDGYTVVLDAEGAVQPGSTNTLKFAVADVGDSSWDSWVLIEGGSLTTDPDPEPDGEPGDNIHQDDEEVFVEGSLRDVLDELSDGLGVPLDGNIAPEEGGGSGERDCYSAAPDVHYVAFQWWLPIDHGNEVQSDSVTFDLGFYAEQCRHNDGSGMEVGNNT